MCKSYKSVKITHKKTHINARPYKREQNQKYKYTEDYV